MHNTPYGLSNKTKKQLIKQQKRMHLYKHTEIVNVGLSMMNNYLYRSKTIFIGCTFKLICKLKEMNIIPISA